VTNKQVHEQYIRLNEKQEQFSIRKKLGLG
jgi:hypothetical protein